MATRRSSPRRRRANPYAVKVGRKLCRTATGTEVHVQQGTKPLCMTKVPGAKATATTAKVLTCTRCVKILRVNAGKKAKVPGGAETVRKVGFLSAKAVPFTARKSQKKSRKIAANPRKRATRRR
ncbi:MAG: hypothetical protein Q8S13_14610 [Dehalococcoidia bacterium]|nr:hypothetical protein [Dehalococcoidia bacterium]